MREGEKRRGLSAHSPSPRAQHPNPRSRTHERPRRPPGRDGEKWMTPFHTPQAKSGGLWDGDSHKISILRFHKPPRMHAKTPNILYTYCVGHRERWIACTAVDSSDTPWHFTARRTKFHCRLSPKCKWIIRVRNMVFWKWNERGENRFKASSIFSPDAMGGLWGAWPALWVTSARPGWACWVKKMLYYSTSVIIYLPMHCEKAEICLLQAVHSASIWKEAEWSYEL